MQNLMLGCVHSLSYLWGTDRETAGVIKIMMNFGIIKWVKDFDLKTI